MKPLILFAPGAGAPSSHPWMQNWKVRLSEIGEVETFDYDYMREGRKRPDPLPQLIAAHRKALNRARERYRPERTILVGKSMGGRVGCHVSLEEKVDRLICPPFLRVIHDIRLDHPCFCRRELFVQADIARAPDSMLFDGQRSIAVRDPAFSGLRACSRNRKSRPLLSRT